MTYDEAIQKAEELVAQLEQAQALSVREYQEKATEVKRLLDTCEKELKGMNYSSEK